MGTLNGGTGAGSTSATGTRNRARAGSRSSRPGAGSTSSSASTRLLAKILHPRPLSALVARLAYALAVLVCVAIVCAGVAAGLFARTNGAAWTSLSKPTSIFNKDARFSTEELAEVRATFGQGNVFPVRNAEFRVSAGLEFGGRLWSSELFLESLPSEALGEIENFTWQPGEEVPVLIADEFLLIYNTSFAAAYGLPQASAQMLGLVTITLDLWKNGKQSRVLARVVGTTNTITSILVPDNFLAHAHAELGGESPGGFSKLLVNPSGSPDSVQAFAQARGYQSSDGRLASNPVFAIGSAVLRGLGLFAAVFAAICLVFVLTALRLELRESAAATKILLSWGHSAQNLRSIRRANEFRWAAVYAGLGMLCAVALGTVLHSFVANPLVVVAGALAALGMSGLCLGGMLLTLK